MKFIKNHKKKFIAGVVILFILMLSGDDKKTPNTSTTSNNTNTSQYATPNSNTGTNTYTTPTPTTPVTNPVARGNRILGMGLSVGGVDFGTALAAGQKVRVQYVEVPSSWGFTEKSPGQYDFYWLNIANQYYPTVGIRVGIGLNPIDTNNLALPKDLEDKKMNDPEVIERYKAFVDAAAKAMSNTNVYSVAIGNEIDAYLGSSDSRWREYTEFFKAVAPHVKSKFPNAVVGSKITFNGLMELSSETAELINNSSGVMTTYYPFRSGFDVKDPSKVHEDFKRITELFPNKKIYFLEIGYPSGKDNDSSEEKQAEFVHEAFAAWDTHRNNIPLLNFQWLHDSSTAQVNEWKKYYGINNNSFASFLGTLGLRTYDGQDKKAFVQLGKEVSVRGW